MYLDDGESIEAESAEIRFEFAEGRLQILGRFGYHPHVAVEAVTLLGRNRKRSVTRKVQIELTGPAEVTL